MITAHQYTYQDARQAFMERLQGGELTSIAHPQPGPHGAIAMDITYWQGKSQEHVLVISSGTHGIEGYCGSFVQCGLIDAGFVAQCTEKFSLLMIHGVNPYGFAWQRRVNENNVDLNRNFIDFSQKLPRNPGYEELAELVETRTWGEAREAEINRSLGEMARSHLQDPRWLQSALSGGQYSHPHGQFFGGVKPQWSNVQVRAIAARYLQDKDVVWIDVHTALGEYATAKCIVEISPDSPNLTRAQTLWGDRTQNLKQSSDIAVDVAGSMISGLGRDLGERFLGTGLEYGTVSPKEVGSALIQDQWLHRFGDVSRDSTGTKQRMMNAFYPDDRKWRDRVLDIAREVTAIDGLF